MATIRRAGQGDIDGIKHVLAQTWRDTYGALLPASTIEMATTEWHAPAVLAAEMQRPTTYVGVATGDSGGIIGVITTHLQDDILFIARMYVLPAHQRQGLGMGMLSAAARAFPTASTLRLEVEDQNPIGRSFYEKAGFSAVERRAEDILGTTLTLIVMQRQRQGLV